MGKYALGTCCKQRFGTLGRIDRCLISRSFGWNVLRFAVIDYGNTAGYNKGDTPAMIVAYTAAGPDKQVQCIAYSLDKGRTFTKYTNNPVIDSKHIWNSHDTRDPKIFWYTPEIIG